MTGGNLRLLTRLLTQVERVFGVNDTQSITVEIVDAARDSLVTAKLTAWHLRQIIPQNLRQTIPQATGRASRAGVVQKQHRSTDADALAPVCFA
jgi:hypothetical protein